MIKRFYNNQSGQTLVMALVAVMLVAIVGLGLAKSLISSLHIMKHTEIHYAASNLASSQIELLAARDSSELTPSLNSTESAVSFPGTNVTFTRTTTITTNADDTRTINVVVQSNNEGVPTSVSFTTSLSVWE